MKIDFAKGNGLVPAVIQDWSTNKVLMLGYMNEEALKLTKAEGKVTFYSRTKDRLWTKGETSGNFLNVREIKADCDNDTLLIKVDPQGPTCHTGADTCFDESNSTNALFLHYLQDIIVDRKNSTAAKSYTKLLFDKGINKIAQKVGEEAVELVIEAKDSDEDLFKNEAADLLFHLLVLLEAKEVKLEEVVDVLKKRHMQ
ncbi:MAG: bifunctional phosphoribosyl-AMP cyclohydrolase/phosphoribosyl-ATP diphosphatase HisIE [Cyclobacteriaceae bacterium]|nr:bifunctional phosphoribosyl-AMP cyclohydrolase/phosphoribosyl-ATP diphosphatase HisIE [Cyclobacteriaceae bacterium]